jgi:hypothetical protein
MLLKTAVLVALAVLFANAGEPLRFMGRTVTITEAETDEDGYFPKGPASVCLEAPPRRQCYTAPKDFGRQPEVEVVQVSKNTPALLFSAKSGGVSGFRIHFALLRPGIEKDLDNLFNDGFAESNQSQHALWGAPAISEAPVFVTADFVWGPGESHYEPHRYTVSAYVWQHSDLTDSDAYWLDDRYMTARKYDLEAGDDLLVSEKSEILARLGRIHAK